MAVRKRTDILGKDLKADYLSGDGRQENLDIVTAGKWIRGEKLSDLAPIEGTDNATQAVIHRIKTIKGELKDLGHPEYGSRHHELIGQPNSEHNRNLVKLYILQALALEPRIEKIHRAEIAFDPRRAADRVEISITLSFIGVQNPTNLVIPFSFQEAL